MDEPDGWREVDKLSERLDSCWRYLVKSFSTRSRVLSEFRRIVLHVCFSVVHSFFFFLRGTFL